MSQPNSGFGATDAEKAASPAPPPNPKIQAVDFALRLAEVNSTLTPRTEVTATALVANAEIINQFLGTAS